MTIGILLYLFCGVSTAQDKQATDCPKITVVAPAGVINSGDAVRFRIDPELKGFKDLRFEWTVSPRPPSSGQGTSEISIKTDYRTKHEKIIAKAVVIGLPPDCVNTAEDYAIVVSRAWDIFIDVFGKIPRRDQMARLDNFFAQLDVKYTLGFKCALCIV